MIRTKMLSPEEAQAWIDRHLPRATVCLSSFLNPREVKFVSPTGDVLRFHVYLTGNCDDGITCDTDSEWELTYDAGA